MRTAPKIGIVAAVLVVGAVAASLKMSAPPKAPGPSVEEPKMPSAPRLAAATLSEPVAVDASAPAPAAAAPVHKKAAAAKAKQLTEAELMEKLRKAQDTDEYQLSYDLAREGLRRFPDSQDAPEMAAMVVKSLARQGKVSEARAEAEVIVNKYPGTHWAHEVERHTGAHPIRNQVPPK